MKNVSKFIVSAKKHLRNDTKYDIAKDEIEELMSRNDTKEKDGLSRLINECFYFGFECGRRYEKNK